MAMVPFPSYTRCNGYRNLAAHWPNVPHGADNFKPDLGNPCTELKYGTASHVLYRS